MNLLSIAIILTYAAASASASTTTSAEERVRDPVAALKVNKTAKYNEVANLENVISLCKANNFFKSAFKKCAAESKLDMGRCRQDKYAEMKTYLLNRKREAISQLEEERIVMNFVLDKFKDLDQQNLLGLWAKVALEAEMSDWHALSRVLETMTPFINNDSATANGVEAALPKMSKVQSQVAKHTPNGDSLSEIKRVESDSYKEFVQKIKNWVLIKKLFDNPSAADPAGQLNPDDFINTKSLGDLVTLINVPEGRFKVLPIEPTMNLSYILGANGSSMTLESAVDTLKRNFETYKAKFTSGNFADELSLLDLVISALFDVSSVDGRPLSDDVIKMRMKGLARVAEGVIRSMHEGKDTVPEALATKIIKSWIISRQMVRSNGWRDEKVEFGVLALPPGVILTLPTATDGALASKSVNK